MNYFSLPFELDESARQYYVGLAMRNAEDYYSHHSSGNNDYTNVQILFIKEEQRGYIQHIIDSIGIKPTAVSIMKCNQNKEITPHTDGSQYNRNSVLAFPLLPYSEMEYAPIYFPDDDEAIKFSSSYMFSTQNTHQVQNNNNTRLNLQIWYPQHINEMYKLLVDKNIINQ